MTNCDIFAGQVTAYCASALASGTLFYLWRRMGQQDRMRAWRLYGWYCGLMLCGSCFGAVAWAAIMMSLVNVFKGNVTADLAEATSDKFDTCMRAYARAQ